MPTIPTTKSGNNIDVAETANVVARWLTTYRDGTYELYDGVKVSVVVRTKPKPGFTDRWKPDTWRKSWKLT